jgi:site-specific DNA recombinase
MLGVIAEFERATIIDRVIGGMERKAARGEWCGGYRPYGYQVRKTTDTTHIVVPHPDEAPTVPVIFDHYANQRLGCRAIATWLNDQGHRTKAGKPWGQTAVRTVLRNRVYLREVFFRDTWHQGQHLPLIEQTTFNAVQELMAERGDAHSKRASIASDYLLVSRIRCLLCGKAFHGAAAHGKRQRYGTNTCPAGRLRADLLDQAVIDTLVETFQQTDLFEQAIAASRTQAEQLHEQYQAELDAVTGQIGKAEAAIERYLDAFETGSLSEDICGQRVQDLGGKIAKLRVHQGELRQTLGAAASLRPPTRGELAELIQLVRTAMQTGRFQPANGSATPWSMRSAWKAATDHPHIPGAHRPAASAQQGYSDNGSVGGPNRTRTSHHRKANFSMRPVTGTVGPDGAGWWVFSMRATLHPRSELRGVWRNQQ